MRFKHEKLLELIGLKCSRTLPLKIYEKTGKRVTYQAIVNWGKAISSPQFDNVLMLCKYFDVPITEFVKED